MDVLQHVNIIVTTIVLDGVVNLYVVRDLLVHVLQTVVSHVSVHRAHHYVRMRVHHIVPHVQMVVVTNAVHVHHNVPLVVVQNVM